MSAWSAVRCPSCAGVVSVVPGQRWPSCSFCGNEAASLVPTDPPEEVERPTFGVDFRVDAEGALAAFRAYARSSWFFPNDLVQARVELRPLWIPAWVWSGESEGYWAALRSAGTRSGFRPVSGSDRWAFDDLLLPASRTLSVEELRKLGPYDLTGRLAEDELGHPRELSELTRRGAHALAEQVVADRHRQRVDQGFKNLRFSAVVRLAGGQACWVPVYVGVLRYRGRPYRLLVQGQTGALVGHAPWSAFKVALAVLAVVLVLGALFGFLALALGCLGLVSQVA